MSIGTINNKTEDSYMNKNNGRLDGYFTTAYSNYYYDLFNSRNLFNSRSGLSNNKFDKDTIKDVIFNDPATIVIWKDGTKTVTKCQTGDTYSKELGLAMCIIKKCCGNKGNYNDVFNKWIK